MRYLELAELSQLNTLLADIISNDGAKIFGRVECYSCTLCIFGADLTVDRQGRWAGQEAPSEISHQIPRGYL